MSFDHLRATYFEESAELLESAYAQLSALAEDRADGDTMHALFRAIHSIKGGGGAFGFTRLVGLAHVMETLLDHLRDGSLASTPDRMALLLKATDALADLLGAEQRDEAMPEGFEKGLIAALAAVVESPGRAMKTGLPATALTPAATDGAGWRIIFRPHAALFRHANEPLLLIRALRALGPVSVSVDLGRLPGLEVLEPEDACLAWTLDLAAPVPRAEVEEIFEFVVDECDLTIEPLGRTVTEAVDAPSDAPPMAAAPTAVPRTEQAAAVQSVRVDVAKVDRLVNLVGELVINQAMLVQIGNAVPPEACPGLVAGLETLSQHLRELQEGVMAIRTQPVKSVFSRMPRLVRELSAQLGKDVRLVVTGEATEIDKTVVEQLADPLTHLLRNALDHGVETPEVREAAGKPRQGTVHLSAEQRGGRILIELSDDGRGIDRARVLARAKERGIVAPDAVLTDNEVDELIFMPGFSTAAVVSAVSGRGVGMDVVRRNIQSLGGRIAVESRFGQGSRFVLSLPLTLAVLDGLVVSVGREAYILPIASIVESLRPRPQDIHDVVGRGQVLSIRGAYIPLLALHRAFGVADAVLDPSRGIVVIAETDHAGRVGLLVDDLVGQHQVVVKSMEGNYGRIPGIGGATILGNGRVALILDVAGLAETTDRGAATRHAPPAAAVLH
ncbi:chemotaxis protein CheA [Falsiroseomonas stagni]|uniref:Chemotaxis protein CheA n=1 Tax=Falsiroseomonas stagni DSM 19981 TaxID=1123062 RepID=A0A1I3XAU8_9PROT|nr:chemotaxis protein CheA [Falsiroseomonas stagni]SFK16439.1 two-component system, chemotaxis family, sensor kinase CheA [Falsiroseomonas stagni DSM 19981]